MKRFTILICAVTTLLLASAVNRSAARGSHKGHSAQPALYFTQNRGQVADAQGRPDTDVLFTAHGGQARLFLLKDGIRYEFSKDVPGHAHEHWNFGVHLEGASLHPTIEQAEVTGLKEHFYLPHCPQGITGVPTCSKVIYHNVYPQIDWVVYTRGNKLEYDFVVHPGGDPRQIRLKVQDAASKISRSGALIMSTGLGQVTEHAPVSFIDGQKIPSSFVAQRDGSIGFEVAYNGKGTLVIDPFVEWATYFGGALIEVSRNSAADASGNVYVSGWTNSTAAVAGSGHQTAYGGGTYDAFLVKFDAAGNRKWATYYGGTGTDYGYACAVTPSGDAVYLAGVTSSSTAGSIATTGAYQTTSGGGNEGYLVRFDSTGVRQWGTYFGGSGSDNLYGCAVDDAGCVYIAGYTASTAGIASSGAFQTTLSSANDAFLARFSPSGARLWSTYFGSTAEDRAFACAAKGNSVYITGYTASAAGIATAGSFQSVYGTGSYDMFITRFDTSGNRRWSTYHGGTGSDYGYGCAAFPGGVYVSGYTSSSSAALASAGAYQTISGGGFESVLSSFDTAGSRNWSTFYGGSGADISYGCSVSPQGDVYLSGFTASTSAIASADGVQTTLGGSSDAFVARFDASGSRIWGTYVGGPGNDSTYTCAAVGGAVYVPGFTASTTGIATTGAYQTANGGGTTDAFITRLSDPSLTMGTLSQTSFCTGNTITIPYAVIGSFAAGNTITAQLSDSAGSFSSPVTIGTAVTGSTTLTATIPAATLPGSGYRIRLVAANPLMTTRDNGVNISINTVPGSPGPIIGGSGLCNGAVETYRATGKGNTLSYTWSLPAGWAGSSTADTIRATAGANGGTITVNANNACGSSTPATLTVAIATIIAPGVIVSASDTDICKGTPVTFNAVPVNGGTAPAYLWMKNGLQVGTNSSVYSDTALNNNDTVYVVLTSNSLCVSTPTALSNKLPITVRPIDNPAVTINASPGTTVTANQTITFTASTVYAGSAPLYQWYVSGSRIAGANGQTFTVTGLADGDAVRVRVTRGGTSTTLCSNTDSAWSTPLTIRITTGVQTMGKGDIHLFPNPTHGQLTIAGDAAPGTYFKLSIVNTLGQSVYESDFVSGSAADWSHRIDIPASLPDGLYFLRLVQGAGQSVVPFRLHR